MANSTTSLDWCVVRLGEDHNWWVTEVSDPVRWDVDGLSIVDPRQVDHLIDSVEPLRDYGFDEDLLDTAFITFRIDKDLGEGRVRLKRVKDSIFDTDEKLFTLPDIVDDENGPYADLLDHITRCRVKLLNDIIDFESPLSVDEVEDEIREDQNASFIEGKAVHSFDELTAILDYTPAGFETDDDDDDDDDDEENIGDADLPDIDEEDEKTLKGDASLKWDEDDEEEEGDDKEERRD
ncbi:MAG: hypothetical protein HOH58_12100 [Opitutaceae bacterium]|jgi:hypothetical protein|nr:hypothetical protein [Opitutaceae bacterium]